MPETSTERTIPRGTLCAAPSVSSDGVRRGVEPGDRVGGQEGAQGEQKHELIGLRASVPPPAVPLKFSKRMSRDGSSVGAKTSRQTVSSEATRRIQ